MRVRNKSTATAMLGMSIDASEQAAATEDGKPKPQENKAKRLLKGLLGR